MIKDLYREIVIDHSDSPRNFGELPNADLLAEAQNPLCGDQVKIMAKVESGALTDIAFTGVGCKLCLASTSILTEETKNLSLAEAAKQTEQFAEFLLSADESDKETWNALGNIRKFPSRVRCVSLAWEAFGQAIADFTSSPTKP